MRANYRTRAQSRLDLVKGRIAEALVETMFRRAGYAVSRSGRESQMQRLFRSGRDEFLPDFTIRKPVERPNSDRPLHQVIHIEVKYRCDVSRFLKVEAPGFLEHAKNWADLYLVLVTEQPGPDRSCFQVLIGDSDTPRTCDLHAVAALDVYRSTVVEYEELGTKLFQLMADHRSAIGKIPKLS